VGKENANSQVYVIDTSSILDWLKRYYSNDVFPALWDKVHDLIAEERLIAPYEVYKEIQVGGDEITKWASKHEEMFVAPSDSEQSFVGDMISNSKVTTPKKTKSGLWADPWVVAMAKEKEAIVITGEQARNVFPASRIPDVCKLYKIRCGTFLELMRLEKWVF